MHVHLPKALHNWREVAKEIAIIVVGVVIALSAEQLVEHFTWRHRVRVAEDAIRHELLADDGPEVYQRVALHPCLQDRLAQIRKAVEADRSRAEIAALVTNYKAVFVTYDRVAYDGAMASQVSTHMDQDELDRFTVPYTTLPAMDRATEQEAADLSRLRGIKHNGSALNQAEESQLLTAVEALKNDDNMIYAATRSALPAIRKIGELDRDRVSFYMDVARSAYGGCVRDVPPTWPDN
jgi:hypothetical protein